MSVQASQTKKLKKKGTQFRNTFFLRILVNLKKTKQNKLRVKKVNQNFTSSLVAKRGTVACLKKKKLLFFSSLSLKKKKTF